ncbi:hypothetical protein Ancab_026823 [Ancistrocladus abbreviatus]
MDREQEELQFLGFFGICKESIKIIFTCFKIFAKIVLTLIFPLIVLSPFLSPKIINNKNTLEQTQLGTPTYNNYSDIHSLGWITLFWLIKLAYFIFLFIFFLFTTSVIIYTVALIYTSKDLSFKIVLSVVPKVYKRLMVTFLWSIGIIFLYKILTLLPFAIWLILYNGGVVGNATARVLLVLYLMGLVYIWVIWELASVVSVLEDYKGLQAMVKSKALIKGKMGVSIALYLMLHLCYGLIAIMFVVIDRSELGVGGRIGVRILSSVLFSMVFLLGLVVRTVIYFVCKSVHHENIDKSSLADHLEVYQGEYSPLKVKDLQLEQV